MGGKGSGRWIRKSRKMTVESLQAIDLRWLRRQGLLQPGTSGGMLRWTRNGKFVGFIHYILEENSIILDSKECCQVHSRMDARQEIFFARTPCNFGGRRLWFLCPECRRRCAIVYRSGGIFSCRLCQGLTYRSQQESWPARIMRNFLT